MTLTLTVEIPDSQGESLTDDDIEEIRRAVRAHLRRRADQALREELGRMTREEAIEALGRSIPADRPVLPAEALTREAMYSDHD